MRAIVVDDSPAQSRVIALQLQRLGWCVVEAATARQAARATLAGCDLVLTDLNLAGGSGETLARWLRRTWRNGGGPRIVGMTAGPRPTRAATARAGFAAVHAKPVAVAVLVGLDAVRPARAASRLVDLPRLGRLFDDLGEAEAGQLVRKFLAEGAELVVAGTVPDQHRLAGASAVFGATTLARALNPAGRLDLAQLRQLWGDTARAYRQALADRAEAAG